MRGKLQWGYIVQDTPEIIVLLECVILVKCRTKVLKLSTRLNVEHRVFLNLLLPIQVIYTGV